MQQLRACGVLETVRISAAGFPSRWTYEDFFDRYHLLGKEKQINEDNIIATCRTIIDNTIRSEDKFRYGHTQIFFRAGQVAYLEQIRADLRKKYIIIIQSLVKRFIYQRRYAKIKKSILGVQSHARGMMARRKADGIRRNKKAVIIQRFVRGWLARTKFLRVRRTVLAIQTRSRGFLARIKYRLELNNHKAVIIQKFCRGFLARQKFQVKLNRIIKCQSAVRRFLARRKFKHLKAEARNVAVLTKGFENKIFSMQQKMDSIRQENVVLKKKVDEIPEMRSRLEFLKGLENEIKSLKDQLNSKTERLLLLETAVTQERDEKMQILEEKSKEQQEHKIILEELNAQNENLKELMENMENKKPEVAPRANLDTIDLHEAYQRMVRDKEFIENENIQLREDLKKSKKNPSENSSQSFSNHSHSLSNASSQNEDDFGYSSAKNTLEIKRDPAKKEESPKNNPTTIILRLRRLLEEKKREAECLAKELERQSSKTSTAAVSTEDSIRLSELEIENERLRQDFDSLRTAIMRGDETQVVQDQYHAIQEELTRRRDECVQLKTVLAEQSQSMKSLNATSFRNDVAMQDSAEILEAYQAQKLVNRQLESELTALTEEHNAKLIEFSEELDESRNEKVKLQTILDDQVQNSNSEENSPQVIQYLKHEVEKLVTDNVTIQESNNELTKVNQILMERLREHGLNDSIILNEETRSMATVKRKPQNYQGIFKYQHEDESKIIQRLVTDFSPRIAVTLLPGLPAYVILMCSRYTDLVNTDKHVRTLLTNFIMQSRKFYQHPKPTEYRVLWLVNIIKMYNLLRQYGGLEKFMKFNTESQNQQQLKNFDLTAYRDIIYEKIILFYQVLVSQIQETVKPLIVPTILEHDEMARSKKTSRQSSATNVSTEPISLTNKLELFYKQFQYFGLEKSYIEQIFRQLFSYICAVAMNNLMLVSNLSTWRTGMKIRYNIGVLNNWVREIGLSMSTFDPLEPLTEVSVLLQLRKSEEDVKSICDLCPNLTSAQILKIIKSYRLDDTENPITPAFIESLTNQLNLRAVQSPQQMRVIVFFYT